MHMTQEQPEDGLDFHLWTVTYMEAAAGTEADKFYKNSR